MDNEPEEGEIIDNYEVISSDEELTMRQRIKELEAKNEELEQIAVISRSYSNNYYYSAADIYDGHYNASRKNYFHNKIYYDRTHVPSDASFISSTGFVISDSPRKRRKHKISKQKHHHRKHSKRRRHFSVSSKRNRDKNKNVAHTINSTLSRDLPNKSYSYKDHFLSQSDRNSLHLAVARHAKNSNHRAERTFVGLRERLLNCNNKRDVKDKGVTMKVPQLETTANDDSSDSLEEQELRLIALKSAVLKKHVKRKKRNAESAYSPTDFDQMLNSGILNAYDTSELELDLTNSPIMSPKFSLSPLSVIEEVEDIRPCSTSATVNRQGDTKVIDMDISPVDSDDLTYVKWGEHFPQFTTPPPPTHFNIIQYNHQSKDHSDSLCTSDLQLKSLPLDMMSHSELLTNLTSAPVESLQETEMSISDNNMGRLPPQPRSINNNSVHSCDEEEELALRALLLAKMQSLQFEKRQSLKSERENQENNAMVTKVKVRPMSTTEFILKQAVKRFRSRDSERKDQSQHNKAISVLHESNATTSKKCKQRNYKVSSQSSNFEKKFFSHMPGEIIDLTNDNENVENCDKELLLSKTKDLPELHMFQTTPIMQNDYLKVMNEMDVLYKNDFSKKPFSGFASNQIVPRNTSAEMSSENLKENFNISTEYVVGNSTNCHKYGRDDELNVPATIVQNEKEGRIMNSTYEPAKTRIERKSLDVENIHKSNPMENKKHTQSFGLMRKESLKEGYYTEQTFNVCASGTAQLKSDNIKDFSELQISNKNVPKTNGMSINYVPKSVQSFQAKVISQKKKFDHSRLVQNRKTVLKSQTTLLNKVQKLMPRSVIRTRKIVKPNKVINKNIEVPTILNNNLRTIEKTTTTAIRKMKLNPTNPPKSSIHLNEQSKLQVQPLVINLQDRSSDSFESEQNDITPICETYNDNVSPISLNMENSSHENPLSDSRIERCMATGKQQPHKKLQQFEEKLESFLKSIRSNTQNQDEEKVISVKNSIECINSSISAICATANQTPVAVCHLPSAAQQEYRRLIHRMKLLENQKNIQKLINTNTALAGISPNTINSNVSNKSLCKSVLLKNTSNNTTDFNELTTDSNTNTLLTSYEKQCHKVCAEIVNNLDKSLSLVADAKEYKLKKLSLERRIKILREELNSAQIQYAAQQVNMKQILPIIGTTNKMICALKKKHSQIIKKALNLDKNRNEEDYSSLNEINLNIAQKIEQLSKEIKVVNSLTTDDIVEDNLSGINEGKPEEVMKLIKVSNQYKYEDNKSISQERQTTARVMGMSVSSNQLKMEGSSELQNTEVVHNLSMKHSITHNENSAAVTEGDTGKHVKNVVKEYKSPLQHLKNFNNTLDPHGILCPYQLMGECQDTKCAYMHLAKQSLHHQHL